MQTYVRASACVCPLGRRSEIFIRFPRALTTPGAETLGYRLRRQRAGDGAGMGRAGEELAGKSLETPGGRGLPLDSQPAMLRDMDFTRRQKALIA